MKTVTTLVAGQMKNLQKQMPDAPSNLPNSVRQESYKCDRCKDIGWFYPATSSGEAKRCSCKEPEDRSKRAQVLLRLDGLTTAERERRFHQLQRDGKEEAIDTIEAAVQAGKGIITLFGKPGMGKSTLLICAVNAGREMGKLSIYTTMSDLLSYLRSTFGPDSEESFDRYWDALIRADILALDELDEFNATPWATERFLRLLDERWRRMDECLTLCATNARVNALHGKISSRLQDHRASIHELTGKDMRRMAAW